MKPFTSIPWHKSLLAFSLFCAAAIAISCSQNSAGRHEATISGSASASAAPTKAPTTAPSNVIPLNLDNAVHVTLPVGKTELIPVAFGMTDGREGWAIRLPGNRPIATPAYAKGMLFVGGGYGSHEFYALDAKTGAIKWTYKCDDDGPTAAVVDDDGDCVVFDTESCEEEVLEVSTGKRLWKEWLGDPIVSQPAIANGKIYQAYPGAAPHGIQKAGEDEPTYAPTAGPAKGYGHRLLCQDLKTGKHLWEQDITADVVSAPVVHNNKVLITCFDGTSFCMNANTGAIEWSKKNLGTSAPLIANDHVIITQRADAGKNIQEGIKRVALATGDEKDNTLLAAGDAAYLRPGASGNSALSRIQETKLESSVGFTVHDVTTDSPADRQHLNIGSVAVGWSYQGPRAALAGDKLLNAQGNMINCLAFADGQTAWRAQATGKGIQPDVQLFAPPALGEKNLYVCSASGHIASLRQSDGKPNFIYSIKRPMNFQPTLANGNIYVGTVDGLVVCIKTKDKDADGWYAWGGNAQHNKSR